MNETEEKMCLDNIEEFLMDQNKIVTFKYLSRSLNISVNDAKRLLTKYASTCNSKSSLASVFAVGGELKDNKGFSVIVTQDKDLENVKSQFEKVSWEHLYSLQKDGQVSDLNTLHIANNVKSTDENENSVVGIPYWKDTQRNDIKARSTVMAEAASCLKQESKPQPKKPSAAPSKPAQAPKTPTKSPPKNADKLKSSPSPKKETGAKDKNQNAGNKSGGIAAMFAAQKSKTDSAPKPKAKPDNTAAKKGSQSISSFFTGQPKNPVKKSSDSTKECPAESSSSNSSAKKSPSKNDSQEAGSSSITEKGNQSKESQETAPKVNGKEDKSQKSKNVSTSKKPATSNKKDESKTKKIQKKVKGKSSEPPQKKRKRVMIESDSENSSAGESDAESNRSNSPEPSRSPSPQRMEEDEDVIPATPAEPQRKRKRKAVAKTVMDENGFLCTTKEYVYESCSDNEENDENKKTNANSDNKPSSDVAKPEKGPEVKKASKQPASKQPASKQPTKQQSLISFFKKK